MDISKLDKNLAVAAQVTEPDLEWFNVLEAPFVVDGIYYNNDEERFLRMPREVAKTVNEGVYSLCKCTAGGSVRFKTDSSFIAISAVEPENVSSPHLTHIMKFGFDMYKDGTFFRAFPPPVDCPHEYASGRETFEKYGEYDGNIHDYLINFPLYNGLKELYIGVKKGSKLLQPDQFANQKPIVFYGSSITQGACASRPGNCYTNMLCRKLNLKQINLGFSGNCKGEPEMADYIASLDMSAFVLDFDHNITFAEQLEKVHLPFYKRIREAHPNLPIVIISAPDVDLHPKQFLPKRDVVIKTYEYALANGDKNVYFVDGQQMCAGDGWADCFVDATHPNDLGFYRMYQATLPVLEKIYNK